MQVSRWKASVAASILGTTLIAAAVPARADDALNFTDPLLGPVSPYLTIDSAKFGYTGAGLTRIQSDSGNANGTDRPVVRTISGAFLGRNFDYQIHVTSPAAPATEDIIYVGFGQGATNPGYYNEPTNSALFRIHNLSGYRQIDIATSSGFSGWPFTFIAGSGTFDPAGTTFRITRHDDVLAMEIVGQPTSLRTFSVSANLPFLGASDAYLFFANTATGTTFSDVQVVSLPLVADSDGDGVVDSADHCPATPAGARVDANGCSGAQLVSRACPTAAAWKNHGAYVSCVARASEAALAAGLLTDAERSAIQSAAARSSIGK